MPKMRLMALCIGTLTLAVCATAADLRHALSDEESQSAGEQPFMDALRSANAVDEAPHRSKRSGGYYIPVYKKFGGYGGYGSGGYGGGYGGSYGGGYGGGGWGIGGYAGGYGGSGGYGGYGGYGGGYGGKYIGGYGGSRSGYGYGQPSSYVKKVAVYPSSGGYYGGGSSWGGGWGGGRRYGGGHMID